MSNGMLIAGGDVCRIYFYVVAYSAKLGGPAFRETKTGPRSGICGYRVPECEGGHKTEGRSPRLRLGHIWSASSDTPPLFPPLLFSLFPLTVSVTSPFVLVQK